MARLDDEAAVLARRVSALRDPQLRVAYVRATLRDTSAPQVFELVLDVAARAEIGDDEHRDLWLVMAVALADPQCRTIREETAQLARAKALHDVATLLETQDSGPLSDAARRVPDFGTRDGRPLSLGERKSLARRPGRDLVLRVLRDPHPDVIRILLGNPRVTEDDLVRLCARRHRRQRRLRRPVRVISNSPRPCPRRRPCASTRANSAPTSHVWKAQARAVASRTTTSRDTFEGRSSVRRVRWVRRVRKVQFARFGRFAGLRCPTLPSGARLRRSPCRTFAARRQSI